MSFAIEINLNRLKSALSSEPNNALAAWHISFGD
jgi:hypothetical protein